MRRRQRYIHVSARLVLVTTDGIATLRVMRPGKTYDAGRNRAKRKRRAAREAGWMIPLSVIS